MASKKDLEAWRNKVSDGGTRLGFDAWMDHRRGYKAAVRMIDLENLCEQALRCLDEEDYPELGRKLREAPGKGG